QDSIRISYNGIAQYIQLVAWGQNAHFLKNQLIKGNVSWPNDLPYVIYGSLTIDSNASLTIQAGVHIYIHADALIYVDGTLNVSGDSLEGQRVYFTGDRLDLPYANYPGSWPGIYFRSASSNNVFNYAVLENGYHTLIAQGPGQGPDPKLSLNQCIINNSLAEGILGIQSSIQAANCLISNCGQNIVLTSGGLYHFEYCTVASYSTSLFFHQQPVLTVSNSGTIGNQVLTGDLSASFLNCIFWGGNGVADEALVSNEGSTAFNILFDHTILKQQNYPPNIDSNALWLNTNPQFVFAGLPANIFDFHVGAGSPAVDHGTDAGVSVDLDGHHRPVNLPDIGCYERQ
ncbi:MAG TPA: choice-of-anchor Q domain-containing protein, partial [Puia sp.]